MLDTALLIVDGYALSVSWGAVGNVVDSRFR